jgi:hypothetical protein
MQSQSLLITGSPDPAIPAVTNLTLVPGKLKQGYQHPRGIEMEPPV